MNAQPINCREALLLLQDYLRAELPRDIAGRVHDHLERCPPCRCHESFERSFLERIVALKSGECCPERVRLRIIAALRTVEQRPPS